MNKKISTSTERNSTLSSPNFARKPIKERCCKKLNPLVNMNLPLVLSADILASSELKLLPDMNPDQSLDVNVSIGLRDFTGEQYKSSLKRLNKAIVHHPHNLTPRFVRGLCFEKLCQYDLALKDFTICCELGVQHDNEYECALAYFNRGVISACLQKFDDAMDHFSAAIELYDLDPDFFGNRALLFRRSGDFQNAQNDYQSIRRLAQNPESYELNLNWPKKSCHNSTLPPGRNIHSKRQLRARNAKRNADAVNNCDLKSSLYGQLYTALACPAKDRSDAQLDLLVKETKMMTAFINFDIDQLRTFWKFLEFQKYATNTRIFEQGDPADDYFVIWTGCVSARVRKESASIRHANVARAFALETEFVVSKMKAGETLGEAALRGGKRNAACVTEEPTELLILKSIHFDSTFRLFLDRLNEEKIEFLSNVQCFKNFDKKEIRNMADFFREQEYQAGNTIIRQNETVDSLYFIKSGLVSILRTPESRDEEKLEQICLTKLSAGDVFGESSVLDNQGLGGLFPSSAVCETKTKCYRLDKKQISRCCWDATTKTLLTIMAVKYPHDKILTQAFKNRKKCNQIRKRMQKELQRRFRYNRSKS